MRRLTPVAVRRLVAISATSVSVLLTAGVPAEASRVGASRVGANAPVAGNAPVSDERDAVLPEGSGSTPAYRSAGSALLVCTGSKTDFDKRIADFPAELRSINLSLWSKCQQSGYRTVQAAVNKITKPNGVIKILPGVYLEEPSLDEPLAYCANLPARRAAAGYQVLTWDQQVACPNNQNLVAVLGKKNLQLEGTGAAPQDVIIDAGYQRLTVLRADRSPGLYLRNFTVQRAALNAVHVMETDGFAVDTVVARWNDGSGLQAYAADHGLLTDCETYGNSEAGISATALQDVKSDPPGRHALEIRRCNSHDNLLGYSGPAGDSVAAHDNTFRHNSAGVATGSVGGLPGLPQNHAVFERNIIAENNEDYYHYVRDGTCARPLPDRGYDTGVVCPTLAVPPGTGVFSVGGNANTFTDNWVYGHTRAGFLTAWSPGLLRQDRRVGAQFDTSHDNRYTGNILGQTPDGARAPNGIDFWWDGEGAGSCWQVPSAGADPRLLPHCDVDGAIDGFGTSRYLADPAKTLKLAICADYDRATRSIPSTCDWFGATGVQRIEIRYALGEAALMALLLILLWTRLLRGRGGGVSGLGLLLSLGGLAAATYGVLHVTSLWTPIGLGALGLGLLVYGAPMRRRGRPALRILTFAIAACALLGAIDQGLWLLPWIPAPPSLVRTLLEAIWVPWAFVAALSGRVVARSSVRADPLVRYTAALRT